MIFSLTENFSQNLNPCHPKHVRQPHLTFNIQHYSSDSDYHFQNSLEAGKRATKATPTAGRGTFKVKLNDGLRDIDIPRLRTRNEARTNTETVQTNEERQVECNALEYVARFGKEQRKWRSPKHEIVKQHDGQNAVVARVGYDRKNNREHKQQKGERQGPQEGAGRQVAENNQQERGVEGGVNPDAQVMRQSSWSNTTLSIPTSPRHKSARR